MKQAILIIGYKSINNIIRIINYFDDNFQFYIHIDKKSKADLTPLYAIKNKNVNIYKEYKVYWGGVSIVKVTLLLVKKALENKDNTYFHLISEQDFPIKPVHYFYKLAEKNKNYLDYKELPIKVWDGNGGFDRIYYYNFYDEINARNFGIGRLLRNIVYIQKAIGIKRKYSPLLPKLFGGSNWWSLTREVLQYVIKASENKSLLDRMKYTFASDEIYFQTVLINSPYFKDIINQNLRYIDWEFRDGNSPAFLDISDFDKIILSDNIFARKFNENSNELITKLLKINKCDISIIENK